MMMAEAVWEANTTDDLQLALRVVCGQEWQARSAYYLIYDDHDQVITYREMRWELREHDQAGACALTLRPVVDQELAWPEGLKAEAGFRMARPIFCWGSLIAVLCLAFEKDPGDLKGVEAFEKMLGSVGEKVVHREKAERFMDRCKELLVQAVEARGRKEHVKRCGKLCSALAGMLDCSPQVQADLLEAAQYHDVGLLTFEKMGSAQAMREHPLVGASLLAGHPELHLLAPLVEAHHERYDGSGMPHGRAGDEVPLEGWILALVEDFVEFWESSLSSFEVKIKEFFNGSAKHHHPDVVDALCGLVDSGELSQLMD